METLEAVQILAALGQSTRLEVFRRLVRADKALAAGDISDALDIPRNTLSSHLAILTRAGLIKSERAGTYIFYEPDLTRLLELTAFLVEGCCEGKSELCEPTLTLVRTLGLKGAE